MLLAIDTATQVMSLALYDGRVLLAEHTWHTGQNHGIQLAQMVQSVLERAGATTSALTALGVCTGPGSYSGLRVGVSLAKGLASVHKLPLVGVTALDVLAAGQPHFTDGLIVTVQAGRGRVVVGRYQWRKGHWVNRGEPKLMDWEMLFKNIDGPAHLSGEVTADGFKALAAAQEADIPVTLVGAAHRLRRAGFLAQEAWERYSANPKGFEAARLLPFYIKTQDVPES